MKKTPKSERMARFVTPDLPVEDDGVTTYKLKFVTPRGEQVERPCTKEAYSVFLRYRPDMQTKVTFWLKYNADGLMTDYSEITAPPDGLFKVEMADGRVIEPDTDRVVFERRLREKEFNPTQIPNGVEISTVEAIMEELTKKGSNIEVEDELLGKYRIHEIAQRAGLQVVTVAL